MLGPCLAHHTQIRSIRDTSAKTNDVQVLLRTFITNSALLRAL